MTCPMGDTWCSLFSPNLLPLISCRRQQGFDAVLTDLPNAVARADPASAPVQQATKCVTKGAKAGLFQPSTFDWRIMGYIPTVTKILDVPHGE